MTRVPRLHELRLAGRALRAAPSSSLLVVAVLALGIGASTAVYSIVRAVLLRPLPFQEAERLVRIETRIGGEPGRVSMREVEELRALGSPFEGIAAYVPGFAYTFNPGDRPEELPAVCTTRNLWEVLGVAPLLGAPWPEEYDRSRNFGVILSHGAWLRIFGGEPGAVGAKVSLDGAPGYTVFGVLPPEFDFPVRTDLYRSLFINDFFPNYEERERRIAVAVARLEPGSTLESARARMRDFGALLAELHPPSYEGVELELVPLRSTYSGEILPYLLLLAAAVVLVLLVACANTAGLLLARGMARQHELELKSALGASRGRLLREVLLEALLLGLPAAAAGAALAFLLVAGLVRLVRFDLPLWMTVEVDGAALAFALALGLLSAVAGALLPALALSKRAVAHGVRSGGLRTSTHRSRVGSARPTLLALEIALSVILLVGAGLVLRSLLGLLRSEIGFERDGLVTFRVALTWYSYRDDDRVRAFHRESLDRLGALPGVEAAALTSQLPLAEVENPERSPVLVEGQDETLWRRSTLVRVQRISPGYLKSLRVPLLLGRRFDATDRSDSELVVLVSERLAERFWPGEEPLGKRLRVLAVDGPWRTVVGVVGSTRHALFGADPGGGGDVYLPATQPRPPDMFFYALRTARPAETLEPEIVAALRAVDPEQAVYDLQPMARRLLDRAWPLRVSSLLFEVFAGVALLLAACGLYGVIAYEASRRAPEIGVRLALGARAPDVLRLVLAQALVVCALGLAVGLAGSWALERMLETMLPDAAAGSGPVRIAVVVLVGLVFLSAAAGPALRALRVDPCRVLRSE